MARQKIINVPYLKYHTHVRVYGKLNKDTVPLIVLHGGPGGTSYKYEPMTLLADEGITVILYDQLGSGYSYVEGDPKELWTYENFENELDNLIKYLGIRKCHLLGHSWGGMLAIEHMIQRKPDYVKSLILFSTLPSTKIWNDEHLKMIEDYPDDIKNALINNEQGSDAYKEGVKRFYKEHVGNSKEAAYKYKRKFFPKTNLRAYNYMWGPNELFGTGTLKDWNEEDRLNEIKVPTLIISGAFDESTPKMNELMNKRIPDSHREILPNSSHGGYVQEYELSNRILKEWVKSH